MESRGKNGKLSLFIIIFFLNKLYRLTCVNKDSPNALQQALTLKVILYRYLQKKATLFKKQDGY